MARSEVGHGTGVFHDLDSGPAWLDEGVQGQEVRRELSAAERTRHEGRKLPSRKNLADLTSEQVKWWSIPKAEL
jgi:hypothetical protein